MICEKCGKNLEGEEAFQVRYGYVEDGEFYAEEDVAYFCDECGVERGNF